MTIKVGTVKVVDAIKCTARVQFEDTGMLSGELQIGYKSTGKNKEYFMPSIEEQVIVGFTEQKVGYIMCSIYSDVDPPPLTDAKKRNVTFEDGASFTYDVTTHTLTITGIQDVVVDGISFKTHTHTCPDGITSPPIGGD